MNRGRYVRHDTEKTRRRGFGYWALLVFGLFIGLVGLLMAAGGVWLVLLGGSWYYAPAGLGLLAAGILMARMQTTGIWLYWLVFIVTVLWALWEVGTDMWALLPRVLAPAVLAFVTLFLIPVARRRQGLPEEGAP
nr:glucose dehydrogenase [Pseudomonas sp.]